MENGTIIGMLPNGYIMQTRSGIQKDLITETYREYPTDEEESRIVAGKSLIRYLVNGKIEILYANGNFSVYDPETDLWTITNNFGKRRCKRHSNGDTFDIEPIPAAVETCAETYAQVLFKEDNVISILYPNGTRYTIHHDGTQIITNGDESEIVFEKLGFSQVRVLSGRMIEEPEKIKDMNKSDADLEFYESLQTSRIFLKDRIMNGQIIQTYLHDKTVIQSFVEVSEFGQTKDGEPNIDLNDEAEGTNQEVIEGQDAEGPYCQAVHLIRRQDMSVTKVTQDGEACLISGPARMELNKNGEICRLGRDYDYLYQMFSTRPEERKGGVFTCMLSKSNITTHDKERNFFAVNSNGTFEKVLAPEISEVDHFNDAPDQIPDDELMEMEGEHATIMSKESKNNTGTIPKVDIEKSKIRQEDQLHDVNKLPVPPRVFFIRSDGSGSEFYTKDRMQDETGRFSHDVIIVKSTEVIGQNPVFMHSYFIPLKTGEINDEEYSVVADIQKMKIKDSKNKDAISIPKNVEEYKQVFRTLIDRPKSKMYLYINYMQHKDFAQFKRNAFNDDLARYKKWKEDSDGSVNKRFGLFEPNEDMKDRSIDKRIVTKIYRERQTERPEFDQNKIKEMRILAVTEKFRHVSNESQDSGAIKVEDKQEKKGKADETIDDGKIDYVDMEGEGADHEPAPAANSILDMEGPRKKRTQIVMEEIADLKTEPYFIPNFFRSSKGLEFIKLNPQKPPNDEVLMRMSQRMSRSIGGNTHGGHGSSQGNNDHIDELSAAGSQHKELEDNNPIVALEPEDNERDQMRMSGMKHTKNRSIEDGSIEEPSYIPSMYLQEKDYLVRRNNEQLLKAEEYHVSKTKEFNVYGKLRPLRIKVKSTAKSNIKPEMNERFITTECITDKRIKISSMANRAYINAPGVDQVRKQGQHQMILQAISKKQTFNELISQANAMVTSVLNDPMKRAVNILPSSANFGSLKEGGKYELVIACKNEDMLPQRINIKPAKDKRIRIQQESTTVKAEDKGGPIAPGVTKQIRVIINTNLPGDSVISDSFEIATKTDIYKIPITATILIPERFDEMDAESYKIHNKSAMKPNVREVQSRQKKNVKEILNEFETKHWIETTGSESKLPSLPNIKQRAFEPDSNKELDEVIRNASRGQSRKDSNASRLSKRSKMSRMSNMDD